MENQKIRVVSGIKVEVNDAGECIVMNVEDQSFLEKFYGVIEKISSVQERMESAEVKAMEEREQLQELIEQTKGIMQEIDALFGADACRKVFGDIVPTPYLLAEFFDQMIPITDKYADERQKRISAMYSRNRKGARSGK